MPPAARITDMHTCPMQTPAFPSPIPHVGGPVAGPGLPTGLEENLLSAIWGVPGFAVGPPDVIAKGPAPVMFGGKPPAGMGVTFAHAGRFGLGAPPSMIGG